MISSRPPELGVTVWASDPSGAANVAAMPTPAANSRVTTPDLAVKCRPFVIFIVDSPVIEPSQYELSYEISIKGALLRAADNRGPCECRSLRGRPKKMLRTGSACCGLSA